MQKIRPYLWFDSQAEEAAEFYVSLFDDSRVEKVVRSGPVTLVDFRSPGSSTATACRGRSSRRCSVSWSRTKTRRRQAG